MPRKDEKAKEEEEKFDLMTEKPKLQNKQREMNFVEQNTPASSQATDIKDVIADCGKIVERHKNKADEMQARAESLEMLTTQFKKQTPSHKKRKLKSRCVIL